LGGALGAHALSTEPGVLLFHNGTVITLDGESGLAKAVLVREGRVAEVGGPELVERVGGAAKQIDLGGRVVVPGFIDAHNHFSFSAFQPDMVDCSTPPLESLVDVLATVARHCEGVPADAWVRGWGFHSSQVREGRNPTRGELDEVAPENPVVIIDVSFHACYVNSRALELTGLSRHTPDPPRGSIGRDRAGEPNGTLLESASDLPQRDSWLEYIARDRDRAVDLLERQCRRFLALGITTVGDALVLPPAADLYLRTKQAGKLLLSVTQLHGGETFFDPPRPDRRDVDLHAGDGDLLHGGIVKIFMDGAYPSPAIDRLSEDGCLRSAGETNYTPEELAELVLLAAGNDLDIAIHCGGNRAVERALDAFAVVRERYPATDITLRIEHSFIGGPGQAERFADLGVHLVTQPGLARAYGHVFAGLRGEDQSDKLTLFPTRSMLDAGVLVAGSSDYPCGGGLAPLEIMSAAVERRLADGEPIDPDEAVGREDALRMHTVNAARACNRERIEGSITPGKRANLVVLDGSPLESDPRAVTVLQTWVDGELRYSADSEL
jgi:predicted amidohydrolase YtcJ